MACRVCVVSSFFFLLLLFLFLSYFVFLEWEYLYVRTYLGSIWKESDGIEWDREGAVMMMMMMMIRVKGGYRE